MRSGDLLSEGIIYVREGVGAGVAPTEQVAERVRDKTKPDQARPNPLYDI